MAGAGKRYHHGYRKVSRQDWGQGTDDGVFTPSSDQLQVGCLLRIADALEVIAKHLDPERKARLRRDGVAQARRDKWRGLVRAMAQFLRAAAPGCHPLTARALADRAVEDRAVTPAIARSDPPDVIDPREVGWAGLAGLTEKQAELRDKVIAHLAGRPGDQPKE